MPIADDGGCRMATIAPLPKSFSGIIQHQFFALKMEGSYPLGLTIDRQVDLTAFNRPPA